MSGGRSRTEFTDLSGEVEYFNPRLPWRLSRPRGSQPANDTITDAFLSSSIARVFLPVSKRTTQDDLALVQLEGATPPG
jgi:hypothetical protein